MHCRIHFKHDAVSNNRKECGDASRARMAKIWKDCRRKSIP